MGLFDFGDRSSIQTLAYRMGVGVEQMEDEIKISPSKPTPMLRGLAHAVRDERIQMMHIASALSQSSLDTLNVEFKRVKIPFRLFLQKLIPISFKIKEMTGIEILY